MIALRLTIFWKLIAIGIIVVVGIVIGIVTIIFKQIIVKIKDDINIVKIKDDQFTVVPLSRQRTF